MGIHKKGMDARWLMKLAPSAPRLAKPTFIKRQLYITGTEYCE